MRSVCKHEGCVNLVKGLGYSKTGKRKWSVYCSYHHKKNYESKYSYRQHKTNKCSFCSFVAVHPCQLDVDHIDGNHSNNEPSNLQTLCANCHRLKTFLNKDNKNPDD